MVYMENSEGKGKTRTFKHLAFIDRLKIEALLQTKVSVSKIAEIIGCCRQTIYRELDRGTYLRRDRHTWNDVKAYSPDIAEQKYRANLREKGRPLKIGSDWETARYIENRIVEDRCSPDVVAAELRMEPERFHTILCTRTIYNYIDRGYIFPNISNEKLPYRRKRKRGYRQVRPARAPKGTSIEKRPEKVADREEFGHWEMDTVVGKSKTKKCLLVLTERKTRMERIFLLPMHSTAEVVKVLDQIEEEMGSQDFRKCFRSITVDNGCEFQDCAGMEAADENGSKRTEIYYCHPYSSYERGSNECQNRIIRHFFPKKTDFSKVSEKAVKQVEHWMNHYLRRNLGYHSPQELYDQELAILSG